MLRRNFLKGISLMATAPRLAYASATDIYAPSKNTALVKGSYFDEIVQLADNVFFAKGKITFFKTGSYADVACNNGWIIFEDFVVVIDANFPAPAAALLTEIRNTTQKPVKYVFNTHHHGDHLYGNGFWTKQGATCIAHTGLISELQRVETGYLGNTAGRWEQVLSKRSDLIDYRLVPPPVTFTDKMVIEDKSTRLELLHIGAGHTKGDAVAWLPGQNILFTGDSCLNGPFNLFRDADFYSWITTLDSMQNLKAKIIAPGHGPLGDESTVADQQKYFTTLYDWVANERQAGITANAMKNKLSVLRAIIEKNQTIKRFLIAEPEVATGFSLNAQTQKIYETISITI